MQNSLLDAYAESGMIGAAIRLLDRLCNRDVVSWTSVISGCVYNGMLNRRIMMFLGCKKMGCLQIIFQVMEPNYCCCAESLHKSLDFSLV